MINFHIVILVLITNIILPQTIQLVSLNGPNGGIIGDLAITSNGIIYAGAYAGPSGYYGLYRSSDNGNSWTFIQMPKERIGIYAIFINSKDEIFLGTNGSGSVWKSTDNGTTWLNINNGYNVAECWAFGETKDGIMLAGSAEELKAFRSSDYGNSWEYTANIAPTVFVSDNNNNIYAGSLYFGLFASKDSGQNWSQNYLLNNLSVTSIVIDKNNILYCGTGYYDNGTGLYMSNENGDNWENIGLSGKALLSLAIDSKNNLFVGTKSNGVYKTSDRQTWQNYKVTRYNKQAFRMKINKKDHIFIGSEDEGIYRSIDGGENFEQIGLPISAMRNFVIAPNKNFYCSTASGVQEYNPSSNRWRNVGLNNVQAIDVNQKTGELFAATWAYGILRSTDYGASWINTSYDSSKLSTVFNVKILKDGSVLAATHKSIIHSKDDGVTWNTIPGITPSYFHHAIETALDGRIIVSGFNGTSYALFYSDDTAKSFTQLITLPSSLGIVDLNGLRINSKGDIFIASRIANSALTKIDSGTGIMTEILEEAFASIFIDEKDHIFAGGTEKLLLSTNNGETWKTLFQEDLKYTWPVFISGDYQDNIYIATTSKGLLKTQISTSVNEQDKNNPPMCYNLFQNYPNPFNPSTAIRYQIPSVDALSPVEVLVTLKIYDILGSEVKVLVNEYKSPGSYKVEFDGGNLSSGIYFYKLQAGKYQTVKKMILMR